MGQINTLLKLIKFVSFDFFMWLLEILKLHTACIVFPLDSTALYYSSKAEVALSRVPWQRPPSLKHHLANRVPQMVAGRNVDLSYPKMAQQTEPLSKANFAFGLDTNTDASKGKRF